MIYELSKIKESITNYYYNSFPSRKGYFIIPDNNILEEINIENNLQIEENCINNYENTQYISKNQNLINFTSFNPILLSISSHDLSSLKINLLPFARFLISFCSILLFFLILFPSIFFYSSISSSSDILLTSSDYSSITTNPSLSLSSETFHISFSSTLTKQIPYAQVQHPEPPSTLWGIVQTPYPTGAFWTNLAVGNGELPIGLYPYSISCTSTGINISYGAWRRQVSSVSILDSFVSDLILGSSNSYQSRGISSYDVASVSMEFRVAGKEGNSRYIGHFVKSTPFLTVVYEEGAIPMISSPLMKILSVEARPSSASTSSDSASITGGSQYIVTLGNYQKWLVFCSDPQGLTQVNDTLVFNGVVKSPIVLRVAILPLLKVDESFSFLMKNIGRYPIRAGHSISFPPTSISSGNLIFQYETQTVPNLSSVSDKLLILALPHQVALVSSAFNSSSDNIDAIKNYFPIYSIKGKMTPYLLQPDPQNSSIFNFCLTYNLPIFGWNYNLNDKLTTSQLDTIAHTLINEVKGTTTSPPLTINGIDSYNFGKQLQKTSRMALIADNLGIADTRQQLIYLLETSLLPWLQSMNHDILLYDKTYGGLVTTFGLKDKLSEFGHGWYNDHHFHFGYFVHAIAVIAKLDPPFYEANKIYLDIFIRDICNPSLSDSDFPYVRHKDFFDGHSWASGLISQANGKSQESSSEAANAYYSVYLYAMAVGNSELQKFSCLLLSMEIHSIQYYWHMSSDEIYDNLFAINRMIGNVGAIDVTSSTWFGNRIEYVHGINLMPLSPISSYLFPSSFVKLQFPILRNRLMNYIDWKKNPKKILSNNGNVAENITGDPNLISSEWLTYMLVNIAIVDKDNTWKLLLNESDFGTGNSLSNSLYWVASRAPSVLDLWNNKTDPSEIVKIKVSCSSNSACDILGMTGLCCPTDQNIYLSCCPSQS